MQEENQKDPSWWDVIRQIFSWPKKPKNELIKKIPRQPIEDVKND
jgi:hypothetical protein